MRADRVGPNGGGYDEGFRVVDDERIEGTGRAFDHRLAALDEVEHVEVAAGVVRNSPGEPMASGFDEFEVVESGSFLAPAIAFGYRFRSVHEVLAGPCCGAVPLDVGRAVGEVDRAGLAIEAEAVPVPQFEGENVRGGADFQNHRLRAAAVDGTRRDQEMVVLRGRKAVRVGVRGERPVPALGCGEIFQHGVPVNTILQSEIYGCRRTGIENIITFILRVGHAEMLADVGCERMDLE